MLVPGESYGPPPRYPKLDLQRKRMATRTRRMVSVFRHPDVGQIGCCFGWQRRVTVQGPGEVLAAAEATVRDGWPVVFGMASWNPKGFKEREWW